MFRGWARWAIGLVLIWIAIFIAHNLFGTSWSNRCDPGNAQFNLLKSDPVASFHAQGELFTWENDGPDNSWLCSDASLSLSYVGDPSALYPEIKANMAASGWTELGGVYVSDADSAVFQKDVAGGVRDGRLRVAGDGIPVAEAEEERVLSTRGVARHQEDHLEGDGAPW
jgi:hypothetical protein